MHALDIVGNPGVINVQIIVAKERQVVVLGERGRVAFRVAVHDVHALEALLMCKLGVLAFRAIWIHAAQGIKALERVHEVAHRVVPLECNHGFGASFAVAESPIVVERHIEALHDPSRHHVCKQHNLFVPSSLDIGHVQPQPLLLRFHVMPPIPGHAYMRGSWHLPSLWAVGLSTACGAPIAMAERRGLLTLGSTHAWHQPRAHKRANEGPWDDIEGPLCIAAVVAHKDLVMRVIPAVRALRETLVLGVPDLETPNVFCATSNHRSVKTTALALMPGTQVAKLLLARKVHNDFPIQVVFAIWARHRASPWCALQLLTEWHRVALSTRTSPQVYPLPQGIGQPVHADVVIIVCFDDVFGIISLAHKLP